MVLALVLMMALNATKHNLMLNIFTSFNVLVLCGEILHLFSQKKGRKGQVLNHPSLLCGLDSEIAVGW